jgi:hypothetical protein
MTPPARRVLLVDDSDAILRRAVAALMTALGTSRHEVSRTGSSALARRARIGTPTRT